MKRSKKVLPVQLNTAEVPLGVPTEKNRNFWRKSELLPNATENVTCIFIADWRPASELLSPNFCRG
eukprot:1736320-Rhodomonas_salina.1